MNKIIKPMEFFIFWSRWLQAPLYLGLIVAQGVYVYQFMHELALLVTKASASLSENEVMLIVLGLIDVVMIANLLIMVIIGGYETSMTTIRQEDLIQSIADAFQYISYYHPLDYIQALPGRGLRARGEPGRPRTPIAQILTNSRMSPAEGHRPICQDTGIGVVFLKVGMNVRWDATMSLQEMVNEGVRRAYNRPDNPLRASVLADPAGTRKNTKDNTPAVVHYEIVAGDHVEVICAAKGGGSETSPSSPCSTRPTTSSTGSSRRCRPWAPAGARRASSASASAARRKRPCCWPRNR
jgi:hypothetical protein